MTIHGPVRDPYLSEFSERYDLNSGCSVESTQLLHLAVVLAVDTRPATVFKKAYLYFKKAFDKEPHRRLFAKVRACGVAG